jgi:hypothetical protein
MEEPTEVDNRNTDVMQDRSMILELGDIIEMIAPTNPAIHEMTMYISYISVDTIMLTNVSSLKQYQLNIDSSGRLSDEAILQIHLLNRSDEKGYARQNHLMPGVWVNIHFGGEIPVILTGEITNLEEDMIEVITYPELKTIYLDFKYQGIPRNIPIENIIIREKPATLNKVGSLSLLRSSLEEGEELEIPDDELAEITFNDVGESIITIPEGSTEVKNVRDVLHELYVDANTIVFGEQLGEIAQVVEVPENEQRYGIDVQVNDLMDELLSTIPNTRRTQLVMDNIHNLIARFTELRDKFSLVDGNNNVYGAKTMGALYKPLVQRIARFDTNLRWILPAVMNKRKLYDLEVAPTSEDIVSETSHEVLSNIADIQATYYDKKNAAQTNSLSSMYNSLHSQLAPFDPPDNKDRCISSSQVLTNLEAIVDNLDDFASSVYARSGIAKRKYVVQRYNMGLTKITEDVLKSGKKIYTRTSMTPNDEICLKSVIMLPSPVIKFSTIHLPGTNILDRSTMHENYLMLFRLFKKNMELTPHVIDDLSKELDYERMENETKQSLLSGLHEFVLDKDVYVDPSEQLEQFLEVIIPKTAILIRLFRKYMKYKMSFVSVVRQLEPFSIYPSDISYKQSQEIRLVIREQIKEWKINIGQRANSMNVINNTKYQVSALPNPITRIFDDNASLRDVFRTSYKLPTGDKENSLSTREILLKMLSTDNGLLYTNMITAIMGALVVPGSMVNALNSADIEDTSEEDRVKTSDCATRYLAKKYATVSALQADNNVDELYFDKDLDDTPYHILQKYKTEQRDMSPDLFLEYLIANLIEKHGSPRDVAPSLAKTMIANKKLVEDGNYAILEIRPQLPGGVNENTLSGKEKAANDIESDIRKKTLYFRRVRDNWVKDGDIQPLMFLDTSALFCNISNECSKNKTNQICESGSDVRIRIKNMNKETMLNEFQTRYTKTADELEQEAKGRVESHLKRVRRTHILREVQLYKPNNLAHAIGNYANTVSVIHSPHEKLKDAILGHSDFQSRQKYICQFVEEKCREPMIDNLGEEQHWYYCKDTNVKLFPKSLHVLALEFVSGGDYPIKLQELCAKIGELSDDGDSIVDRYSGAVLRKIDYIDEEGFDEAGFKITSHAIMEKDLGEIIMGPPKQKRVFDSEISEQIYNISSTICRNIDLPLVNIEDFVLRVSNELIIKNVLSESAYKRRSDASVNKNGKALGPYINYKHEIIILLVSGVLLVAIQTAIPSFRASKTFPGCVRSFTGYPLGGIEDTTAIQYIACVLSKIKSSIAPWNAIQKYKAEKIASRLTEILQMSMVSLAEIDTMYMNKRQYLVLQPDLDVPKEHALNKWHHCLPPIVDFTILKTLRPVSSDFKQEIIDLVKRGSPKQDASIQILKSKIVQHSYGLIESINKIVHTKDLALKTSAGMPFMENACCNESLDKTKPILYFNAEDSNIRLLLQRVFSMAKLLKQIQSMNRASMFYHAAPTGMKYPDVPTGHLEENVYAAIIYYCNFDKKLPIPEEYKQLCNEKPAQYKSSWSLLEKMEFLKKNGKRYNVDSLHKLMTLVNRKNMVPIESVEPITKVQVLTELLDKLDTTDSLVIDERLRTHLRNVINQYNPTAMHDTASKELNDLTNYLTMSNKKTYIIIMQFFHSHGKFASNVYDMVNKYIANIATWSIEKSAEVGHNEDLYTFAQFMQNSVQNISKFYPTILLNNADFYKQIPSHWGLSSNHVKDIMSFMDKYYDKLATFRQDSVIMELVNEVQTNLADIMLFIQNIPVYSDIVKNIVDPDGVAKQIRFHSIMNRETLYLLMTHCYYQCIYQYIKLSDDPELLRVDVYQSKLTRRQRIENETDAAMQLQSVGSADENTVEFEEEMNEMNISTSNTAELKKRVADLLLAMFNIESANKTTIDVSYKDIMKKVMRSREKEKSGIIQYLGKMSIQERKIEDQFKQYKLGRWNVGKQKGLVSYDKETYERERGEIIGQMNQEMATGDLDVVSEMRREIYEIEADEDQENDETYDQEAYDISKLGEDYMDGNYYQEDNDQDDDYS